MTVEGIGRHTVTQDLSITIGGTHIIYTVVKVGLRVQFTLTGREGAFGRCNNATVSWLLKHGLLRWLTLGTGVSLAAVVTHHARDGDLPRFPKDVHVFGDLMIGHFEVIVAVTVEVATQAAGLATVVPRYGDRDVVDQVKGEKQTEVCGDDIVDALLVDLYCSVIQT